MNTRARGEVTWEIMDRGFNTKSGTWNETGLKPDYSVELAGGAVPGNISDDADSQLQKAIEVLTPKIAAELQ